MRRRNATAAGNSPRASSRNRCNSDMFAILPVVAGNYGPTAGAVPASSIARVARLQCSHHPPAPDVPPLAVGSDDDRMVENKFGCFDAPRTFFGDALQDVLV